MQAGGLVCAKALWQKTEQKYNWYGWIRESKEEDGGV